MVEVQLMMSVAENWVEINKQTIKKKQWHELILIAMYKLYSVHCDLRPRRDLMLVLHDRATRKRIRLRFL